MCTDISTVEYIFDHFCGKIIAVGLLGNLRRRHLGFNARELETSVGIAHEDKHEDALDERFLCACPKFLLLFSDG